MNGWLIVLIVTLEIGFVLACYLYYTGQFKLNKIFKRIIIVFFSIIVFFGIFITNPVVSIILAIIVLIGVLFNPTINIIRKHKLKKHMKRLMDRVEVILYEEGFRPKKTEDQIQFKLEGNPFLINFDKQDPNYFSLFFILISKDEEIDSMLILFNKLNQNVKYAKITICENEIAISADAFIDENSNIKGVLFRLLNALLFMKNEFSKYLNYNEISSN